jgi:hypothetical protein
MGGIINQPQAQDFSGWMRQIERRMLTQERRSPVFEMTRTMGSGFGKYAIQLFDWNDEQAWQNGQFWSDVGAFNTFNDTIIWIGYVIAASKVGGIQRVTALDGTLLSYQRQFTFGTTGTPTFTAWSAA